MFHVCQWLKDTALYFRARRRLDKEDLFGYILRATLVAGDLTTPKRKPKEKTSPDKSPSSSPLARPLMDVSLNDHVCGNLWKENRTPNVDPTRGFPNPNLGESSTPRSFPEPPTLRSPHFTHFPGQQFPGQVFFRNMLHPALLHSMFGLRGGGSSTPVSITSTPSPLLTPATPLSPLMNGILRSPSPEQQFSGVDLLVTNINENIAKNEIKKKLASLFREHCKVGVDRDFYL